MGYVFVMGQCYGCKQPFSFHPNLVPSAVVEGRREPICRGCVERVNPLRVQNGLEPITILPGAYEPAEESTVSWEGP
jgi:hypothetical protein